ncbi:MAG: NADPH:quinone reductase-like Zn-dependent oxidoreductase, partial [Cryomorphaceae bacterium]
MSTSQQLFSNITSAGSLEFSLQEVDMPEPKSHEVVVEMHA